MSKMWSGRFREPLDPAFESWQRSFPFDVRLLPQEVAASKAHARAIAAAGILTDAELATMLDGLDGVIPLCPRRGLESRRWKCWVGEPIETPFSLPRPQLSRSASSGRGHPSLRRAHAHQDHRRSRPEAAHRTQPQRTNRDRHAALRSRRHRRDIAWAPCMARALVEQARAAGDAVMPSYTHLQRAEPVLVAHWLLAYVSMLERDFTRLEDCRARLNLCPLGSGAIAGATLPLDRTIAAEALGFDGPTANSMDATSDRDFALEFTQALATLGLHISRFAEELTLHSTAEFGFLDLPERFSTGSSAMPQKKNPDLTELIRGKVGTTAGCGDNAGNDRQRAFRSRTTRTSRKVRSQSSTLPTRSPASSPCFPTSRVRFASATDAMKTAAEKRLSECDGRRDLPHPQGSSLPQGAREDRQCGSAGP